MMSADRRDYGEISRVAEACFVFQPVDLAFSGADIAGG